MPSKNKSILTLKATFLVVLLLISNYSLGAQWAKVFGTSKDEELVSICQTNVGDFIAVGHINEYSGEYVADEDLLVIKISQNGKIKWRTKFDCYGWGSAEAVLPTIDGGCVVAATYNSSRHYYADVDIWIIKLDKEGSVIWEKIIGTSNNEYTYAMAEALDGGYLIAGKSDDAVLLLNLSPEGEIIWQKTYSPKNCRSSDIKSVQATMDGGFIMAGSTMPDQSHSAVWISKLAFRGKVEWSYVFEGDQAFSAYTVEQTPNGQYLVGGALEQKFWVLKLNPSGKIRWQKNYGGDGHDYLSSTHQTLDGGFILLGASGSFAKRHLEDNASDILLIKISSKGNIEWQKVYGGDFSEDGGESIRQTLDAGFIIGGWTESWGAGRRDALILKLLQNGDFFPECAFIGEANATMSATHVSARKIKVSVQKSNLVKKSVNTHKSKIKGKIYSLGKKGMHKLKIQAEEGGTTDPVPGAYFYADGSEVTVKAVADSEHNFTGWEGHVSTGSSQETLTFTLDGRKTIKATFAEPIGWSGGGGGGMGSLRIDNSQASISMAISGIVFILILMSVLLLLSRKRIE